MKKITLWIQIAEELEAQGHNFNASQVEGRWKTLLNEYRKVKDHNSQTGRNRKDYTYFDTMELFLG